MSAIVASLFTLLSVDVIEKKVRRTQQQALQNEK